MKKLFQLGAIFCGILLAQFTYAADSSSYGNNGMMGGNSGMMSNSSSSMGGNYGGGNYGGGSYGGGQQGGGCPEDHPCEDQPIQSECWVKYIHYEPCYYTTQRCVEEQIPCKRRCCRYVDQQYEVTKCRMVPQYYTETACRKVPEYYDVEEYKTCKKYVPEQHCRYTSKCYWKHVCGQPSCTTPCPK